MNWFTLASSLSLKVKMKKLLPMLICYIFLLGLMVIGGSSQFCKDKEYWCKFVKHDLTQCKKYPCIASICRKTCGKCLSQVTIPPLKPLAPCPFGCKCFEERWVCSPYDPIQKKMRHKPRVIIQLKQRPMVIIRDWRSQHKKLKVMINHVMIRRFVFNLF